MAANGPTSKKRSDASSDSKPPEPLTFFVDRSLGRHVIASALRQAGADVRVHDDHFAQNTMDEEWLRAVGQKGWLVLTKDDRIRYRAPALAAIRRARARVFVLAARGDLTGAEMAAIFAKALPAMCAFASAQAPPFIARVARDSTVSVVAKA